MMSIAILAAVAANVLAFLVYGYDKAQARAQAPRVPELSLLQFAIIGGIGAWVGCEVFRHKTRKQPFRTWLTLAVIVHIALVFAAVAFLPGSFGIA